MNLKTDFFFDYNNKPIKIENAYRGKACFLVLSGPSLAGYDLSLLRQPGIVTCGVNNSPKVFRPDLWVTVDNPKNFMISAWKDPRVKKFVHYGKRNKDLFDNVKWKHTSLTVGMCPNVVYWYDNQWFQHDKFMYEDTINWGNSGFRCECGYKRKDKKKEKVCPKCNKKQYGCRSVFLATIRILSLLGFSKVFLLGCDFKMELGKKNYAWEQDRTKSSVNNNNGTYERLNSRFDLLRPIFESENFNVFNCYKDSGLKSFDYIPFEVALRIALKDFPDITSENVTGMYERQGIEEKEMKKK